MFYHIYGNAKPILIFFFYFFHLFFFFLLYIFSVKVNCVRNRVIKGAHMMWDIEDGENSLSAILKYCKRFYFRELNISRILETVRFLNILRTQSFKIRSDSLRIFYRGVVYSLDQFFAQYFLSREIRKKYVFAKIKSFTIYRVYDTATHSNFQYHVFFFYSALLHNICSRSYACTVGFPPSIILRRLQSRSIAEGLTCSQDG